MVKKLLLGIALICAAGAANAQTFPPQTESAQPSLAAEGVLHDAVVVDVAVRTRSEFGPFTAFLIRPRGVTRGGEWFFIRNDDVAKALERGAMIGLLMGAAQGNAWTFPDRPYDVNIEYVTVDGRREITAASISTRLQ
jgi:hypothetical protein